MYLFYTQWVDSRELFLTDQEAHHCMKVLRHRVGDTIHAADGKGGYYEGVINGGDKKKVTVNIVSKELYPQENRLTLAFGIIKNTTRLEWLIEKVTEIGVKEIQPLICQRSEKRGVKMERLQKIMISACKQSKQWYFPELQEPVSFPDFVMANDPTIRFIAHYKEGQPNIWEVTDETSKGVTLLIGPEGDFTHKEIEIAIKEGFTPVNLGRSRLRAETAAMVACAHLNA